MTSHQIKLPERGAMLTTVCCGLPVNHPNLALDTFTFAVDVDCPFAGGPHALAEHLVEQLGKHTSYHDGGTGLADTHKLLTTARRLRDKLAPTAGTGITTTPALIGDRRALAVTAVRQLLADEDADLHDERTLWRAIAADLNFAAVVPQSTEAPDPQPFAPPLGTPLTDDQLLARAWAVRNATRHDTSPVSDHALRVATELQRRLREPQTATQPQEATVPRHPHQRGSSTWGLPVDHPTDGTPSTDQHPAPEPGSGQPPGP